MRIFKKTIPILLTFFFMIIHEKAMAHTVIDLTQYSQKEIGLIYLKLGFTHILPLGLDHILFVVCLFLLNSNLKSIIWQASAFTLAHSITLGLSMYKIISPPSHIVEPIIALSIMFVAIENIIYNDLKPTRIIIVFAFGLIHGMGFASVLSNYALQQNQFFNALLTFNLGVELGQITVIFLAWFLIGYWFYKKNWYRKYIVIPLSCFIALIALYWTIERTFLI